MDQFRPALLKYYVSDHYMFDSSIKSSYQHIVGVETWNLEFSAVDFYSRQESLVEINTRRFVAWVEYVEV